MPIHHLSIPVSSLPKSLAFYTALLAPLSYKLYMSLPGTAGFVPTAPHSAPDFWIHGPVEKEKISKNHVAFAAENREAVDAWHANALKEGATCNGPPGVRPQYTEAYYAAYVLDLDGHNIEAVFFG